MSALGINIGYLILQLLIFGTLAAIVIGICYFVIKKIDDYTKSRKS